VAFPFFLRQGISIGTHCASGKQQFQDFALDRMQNDEEAYLAAGYSVAEAETIPGSKMLLPCVLRAGKPRTK